MGITVVAVVVVAGAGVAALRWYAETRFVDNHTVPAPAGRAAGAPTDFGRERWRTTLPAPAWSGGSRRHLVLRYYNGVRAVDALTGRARWHYLRRDLPADAAAVSADGSTVVVVFRSGYGPLFVVGVDEATGVPRWQRWHRLPTGRRITLGTAAATGDVVVFGSGHLWQTHSPVAFDVRNGAVRWNPVELAPGKRCDHHAGTGLETARAPGRAGYPLAAGAAVLYFGPGDIVTAVDADARTPVWTRQVPPLASGTTVSATVGNGIAVAVVRDGDPPSIDSLDRASAPLRLTALDLATGTVNANRPLPTPPVRCGRSPTGPEPMLGRSRRLHCADEPVRVVLVAGVVDATSRSETPPAHTHRRATTAGRATWLAPGRQIGYAHVLAVDRRGDGEPAIGG